MDGCVLREACCCTQLGSCGKLADSGFLVSAQHRLGDQVPVAHHQEFCVTQLVACTQQDGCACPELQREALPSDATSLPGSTNKHAAVCKPFLAACTNARNTEGPLCCESKGSEMEGRWLTCIHMTVLVGHVF